MVWQQLGEESWRGYGMTGFPEASWNKGEGCLQARAGAPRVDLISKDYYEDFELRFEWWLPRAGNSGVLYRVDETAEFAWQTGPELQLLDDRDHPDAQRPETRCGALYDLLAPQDCYFPADDSYKTGALLVQGSYVEHWLNGDKVLSYDFSDSSLRNKISGSKFRDCVGFGKQREGRIVLQHHHSEARFRNIQIRDLGQ